MNKIIFTVIFSLLSLQSAQALQTLPYSEKNIIKTNNAGTPYVIHFFAEWCIICKQQKAFINELKLDERFDKLTIFIADVDFEKALKERLKVERQSTLVLFKDGQEVERSLGLNDKTKIADFLKKISE